MVVLFLVGTCIHYSAFKILMLWYNGWHIYQNVANSCLSGKKAFNIYTFVLLFANRW